MTEEEQAYLQAMQAEREIRESIRQTLNGGREEDAAIAMVREHAAPEGSGRMEEWIRRRLDEAQGEILFPRWQARRRGIGRHEVWFTYTELSGDGIAGKRGFVWMVDLSLKMVEGPRELAARELGSDPFGPRRPRLPPDQPAVELIQD